MRDMFIMQGAPCSGKTTFLRDNGLEDYAVSIDDMRRMMNPAPMIYDDECHSMVPADDRSSHVCARAYDMATIVVGQRMRYGQTVIIDSTGHRRKPLSGILDMARRYGYRTHFVNMRDSVTREEAHHRNAMRPVGMHVPDDSIDSIIDRLSDFTIMNGEDSITPEEMLGYRSVPEHDYDKYDRITVIGDVQGCWRTLRDSGLLEHKGNELVIFSGDIFDRGPYEDAAPLFDWLASHHDDPNYRFVRGNHDSYIRFFGDYDMRRDLCPATVRTINGIMESSFSIHHSIKSLGRISRLIDRSMTDMLAFRHHGGRFFISHAGLHPSVIDDAYDGSHAYMLGFEPSWTFMYGTGSTVGHGDYFIDIDGIIEDERHDDSPIQIHGHRNERHHGLDDFRHVFNLESGVERGGSLSYVVIDDDGVHPGDVVS